MLRSLLVALTALLAATVATVTVGQPAHASNVGQPVYASFIGQPVYGSVAE